MALLAPRTDDGLLAIIRSAIKAVPAVKYALAVAGLGAAVALVAGFTIDLRVAVIGIIILFILMAVMVVFARLAAVAAGALFVLAMVLAWAAVILVIGTALLIFTGVFFNWPRPLSHWIEGRPPINGNLPSNGYPPATRTPTLELAPNTRIVRYTPSANVSFQQMVKMVEKDYDLIITIKLNCPERLRNAELEVAGNLVDGNNFNHFLKSLRTYIRDNDDIKYTVETIQEGKRYEITCP